MTTNSIGTVPNHHAHHPGFAGPTGLAIALLMALKGRDRGRLAARISDVGRADTVVDVGSGPGNAVRVAARAGATAIGVEPSNVMRRVAQLLSIGRSRLRWLDGAAESIPLDDDMATVVWSIATVHHWPDLDAGIDEVRRILGPGGRFLAVERKTIAGAQGVASHGWTPDQATAFASMCEEHGFAKTSITYHPTNRGEVVAVLAVAP